MLEMCRSPRWSITTRLLYPMQGIIDSSYEAFLHRDWRLPQPQSRSHETRTAKYMLLILHETPPSKSYTWTMWNISWYQVWRAMVLLLAIQSIDGYNGLFWSHNTIDLHNPLDMITYWSVCCAHLRYYRILLALKSQIILQNDSSLRYAVHISYPIRRHAAEYIPKLHI